MTHARPGWLALVWLLLSVSRKRAKARMRSAAARRGSGAGSIAYAFALLGILVFQGALAFAFVSMVNVANEVDLEQDGRISVPAYLHDTAIAVDAAAHALEAEKSDDKAPARQIRRAQHHLDLQRQLLSRSMVAAARHFALARGGGEEQWLQRLQQSYENRGSGAFAVTDSGHVGVPGTTAYAVLSVLFAIWWVSLVLQGEGVSLDVSRRRHPMWEWYLGFPIPQSAVFVAEALAPAISNPFILLSPVLLATVVGLLQGSVAIGACAVAIAIPLTLAAAVWAKALEVLIMLRSSLRNRGGWFALLSGVGFLATFMPFVLLNSPLLGHALVAATLPWIRLVPGASNLIDVATAFGWLRAIGFSVLIGATLTLPAFLLMRFATLRGLESGFGSAGAITTTHSFVRPTQGRGSWRTDPLLHKEWLWLKRDRGALIQLIGIPLMLVALQYFNLQNMLRSVELSWNKLAGVVVGMGGYLLFVSGPRALLSEGPALALTLSWPRSLEDTLRMKVRLLLVLVSAMVWLCLLVLMWMFPDDAFKLIIVAVAWPLFGLSVAEKAVTLIRQPSQSGEPEPLPQGRLWAASLGNLTFAIGLFTARWQLMIAAVALNWVFAGALWQGFRIRLAYLFDPDAQPRLPPPTILSSVIAVVGLLELAAIIGTAFAAFTGAGGASIAFAIGYGIAAAIVCMLTCFWHARQGVPLGDLLRLDATDHFAPPAGCLAAVVLGCALGVLALGYQYLLQIAPWPELHDSLQLTRQFLSESPDLRISYAFMAVAIAPWAEEFLFRGLMFRAMLPQWGLLRASVASAAFFTVLHPLLAWPMVFMLGLLSALLFLRTRALLPCIVLHLIYNAVVVGYGL